MGLLATILIVVSFNTSVTNSVSFYETLQYSLTNSYEMRLSNTELQIANINVRKAWTTLLPYINVYYNYKQNPEVSMTMTSMVPTSTGSFQVVKKDIVVQPEQNNTIGVNVSENVFNGSMIPAINIAYNIRDIMKVKNRFTKENIVKVVSNLYVNYLYLSKFLEMLKSEQLVLKKVSDKTADEINLGIQPKWSKLRINIQIQQNKKAILEVKNSMLSLLRELKLFTGKSITPVEFDFQPFIKNNNSFSFEANSLIKLSKLNYYNQKLMYKVTLGRFLPSLSVVFNYSKQDQETAFSESESWFVMLKVNWNILSGTERFFSLQEAGLNEKIAEINLNKSRQEQSNLFQKSMENYKKLDRELELVKETVKLAEKNSELTEESYKLGKSDIISYLDSRNSLIGAKLQLLNAKNQLLLEYINLNLIDGKYENLLQEFKNAK